VACFPKLSYRKDDSAITKSRYSQLQRGSDGQLTFCVNAGDCTSADVTVVPPYAWRP
jgi:hypothetical protein